VLYLTGSVGGATLMTDQTLAGRKEDGSTSDGLASRGWFCHSKPNRVCVFKADYLHGVVPGRGLPPPPSATDGNGEDRRISFMVGFWKARVRPKPRGPDGRPGASMDLAPHLVEASQQQQTQQPLQLPAWVAQGREQLKQAPELREALSLLGPGLTEGRGGLEGPLPCVWERLVKQQGRGQQGQEEEEALCSTPLYDQCFQGF
jgi:hypothetical protein